MIKASDNVFVDLGFDAEEAENLKLRAQLMAELVRHMQQHELNQAQASQRFGLTQPQVSALARGRVKQFSIDRLVNALARVGEHVSIRVERR